MDLTQENKVRAEEIAEIAFQLHRSFLVDVSTEVGKGNVSIQHSGVRLTEQVTV